MKALKEKRFSLRSLIRGGLVILSLFALVFAIGCNTSSDPDPGPGPGPDNSNPTVAPTVPYAISISVEGKPSNPSFQGLAPDLTGITVRVVWSNSQVPEFIPGDKLAGRGFYAVEYCDLPGAGAGLSDFHVAHNGSRVISNGFKLPGVVELVALTFTGSGVDWYADQRPAFEKLGLQGQYNWWVDKDGKFVNSGAGVWTTTEISTYTSGAAATDVYKGAKIDIPISEGYPAMDFTRVEREKLVRVGIGKGSGSFAINNGGLFAAGGTTTNYVHGAETTIANFYRVTSITFAGPEGEFFGFDDDNKFVEKGDGKGNGAKLDKLKAQKIKFAVTYNDNKPARTIGWDEFFSNVSYTLGKAPEANYLFLGNDAIVPEPTAGGNLANTPVLLKFDDETYSWNMTMQYVPKIYGDLETYDGTVTVPLPVYEFQNLLPVDRKTPGNLWVRYNPVDQTMEDLKDDTNRKLLDAIKDKWKLTGSYERLGDTKTKELTFTEAMFNKAQGGSIKLSSPGMASQIATISAAGGISGKVTIQSNFPLPIRYRNDNLRDEDETVLIDIYYEF